MTHVEKEKHIVTCDICGEQHLGYLECGNCIKIAISQLQKSLDGDSEIAKRN